MAFYRLECSPSQLAECALSALLARFEKRSWLTVRTEREEDQKGRAVSGSRGDRDGQKGRPAVTHTFNDFRLIHNRGPSISALLGKPSIIKPGETRSFCFGRASYPLKLKARSASSKRKHRNRGPFSQVRFREIVIDGSSIEEALWRVIF